MKDATRVRRIALPLLIRQAHAYVSVLLAPTVLFLSITGCLQVYSLHEAHGDYAPPPVIEKMGMLHKKQVWQAKAKRPPSKPAADAGPPQPRREAPPSLKVAALKALFFAAGASLVLTALLGLWMAVKYTRRPIVCWVLLGLGTALPLLTFALPG